MTDVLIAQEKMHRAFPPERYGNSVKAAIWAAYRSLKLVTERRAETIWYGSCRIIKSFEMNALDEELARQEAHEQITKLQETAAILRQMDQKSYSREIETLERIASGIVLEDCSMDEA